MKWQCVLDGLRFQIQFKISNTNYGFFLGMSTIPEVLVARHCGMSVFGFSFITNRCINSYDECEEPNHGNILDVVNAKAHKIKEFVQKFVEDSRHKWT